MRRISQKTILALAKLCDSCFEYNTYPGSGAKRQTNW
jgi:hypothetical protein